MLHEFLLVFRHTATCAGLGAETVLGGSSTGFKGAGWKSAGSWDRVTFCRSGFGVDKNFQPA